MSTEKEAATRVEFPGTKFGATMAAHRSGAEFFGRASEGPFGITHQKFGSRLLDASTRSAHVKSVPAAAD